MQISMLINRTDWIRCIAQLRAMIETHFTLQLPDGQRALQRLSPAVVLLTRTMPAHALTVHTTYPDRLTHPAVPANRPLKNVISTAKSRHKMAKKTRLHRVNRQFELFFNAIILASTPVLQQSAERLLNSPFRPPRRDTGTPSPFFNARTFDHCNALKRQCIDSYGRRWT